MCDPTGSRFECGDGGDGPSGLMGDEVPFTPGKKLVAQFPVTCHVRLLKGGQPISDQRGDRLELEVTMPGVYRVEAWLEIGGEERPWLFTNPIYVR